MPAAPAFTICCALDADPRFYVEAVLWVVCATRVLPRDRYRAIVYAVGEVPHDLLRWVELCHVEVRHVSRLLEGAPHCNKLIPLFDAHDGEFTIVTDVDLFFVSDPTGLLKSGRVRAAPNNHTVPPPEIFKLLLATSGLGRGYRPGVALFANDGTRETHINNISAGIVVVPAARRQALAEAWKKWAEWLIQRRDQLSVWQAHIDQIAFALAMEELGEDVEFLPPQVNTILHILSEVETIYAMHLTTGHIPNFPDRFGSDRLMLTGGLSKSATAALERLNSMIGVAVRVIQTLPSTRDHFDKFLNPNWRR